LILWWLQDGELRFGELRRRVPTITQKMLAQQLRQMEKEDLVHREVFAQVPPKVIYALTERGQSLRPVLRSLYELKRTITEEVRRLAVHAPSLRAHACQGPARVALMERPAKPVAHRVAGLMRALYACYH
jgi:DNA-binding HxlR family transcriptional regulator